jgi:phosphoribosylamine-glycine ligase
MYFSEWVRSGFPQEKHARIGDLPGIERVMDVYAAIDDADLVVFPDVVTANLASYVKKLGKSYFGTTKHAAELELDRWGFRDVLRSVGLPVPEATRIFGTDDLKKVLKSENDVYVKYGRFRGDLETFHHDIWFTTEQWFDDTVRHLGPSAHEAEFIIEEPIKGVEVLQSRMAAPSSLGI